MKKIQNSEEMAEISGGSWTSFCVGYVAGATFAMGVGMTLGPVGIGVVAVGFALCLAGDSTAYPR